MLQQVPLQLRFNPAQTFASFLTGGNEAAMAALAACAAGRGETLIFLWGGAGLGKSHLLNASCQASHGAGKRSAYLPLAEIRRHGPEILEGLEQMDLLCLDDIHCVAGEQAWEHALFHLFNRLRDAGGRLIAAADASPPSLPLGLPDLRSRLGWGLTFRINALTDEDKLAALSQRAKQLGMELTPAVGHYLLTHCPRDQSSLWRLLDLLDQATLAAKRKLTIPFIKLYLENGK